MAWFVHYWDEINTPEAELYYRSGSSNLPLSIRSKGAMHRATKEAATWGIQQDSTFYLVLGTFTTLSSPSTLLSS